MEKRFDKFNLKIALFLSVFILSFGLTLPLKGAEGRENDTPNTNQNTEENQDAAEEINWGELKVKGLEKVVAGTSDTGIIGYDFTYSLENADPNVKVIMIQSGTPTMRVSYDKTTPTSGVGYLESGFIHPGLHVLKFNLYRLPNGDSKIIEYRLEVKPKAIADVSLKKLTVWHDSIAFYCLGNTMDNGERILLQQKKGDKWVDVTSFKAGDESGYLSDLKPDTKYSFRLAGLALQEGEEEGVRGPWSKTLTVMTGKKEKPVIKKVTISNSKEKYTKSKFIPGHFVGNVWKEATTTAAGWDTTANFKIVLKKKPAGSVGAMVFDQFFKLKGNTIEGKIKMRGQKKGKKISVEVVMVRHKDYQGYSLTSKPVKAVFK